MLLANATGWADGINDFRPAMVLDQNGVAHVAWQSFYDLLGRSNYSDFDVHYAYVPVSGSLFTDNFESGGFHAWGP